MSKVLIELEKSDSTTEYIKASLHWFLRNWIQRQDLSF